MHSWVRRATSSAGIAALLTACAGSAHPPAPKPGEPFGSSRSPDPHGAVEFNYTSLDDRPVSSATLRGKPSVIAFVSSDELASQAEAGFLAAMAKNDGDKVNYVLISVETDDRRELVEGFRAFFEKRYGVSLRTAMGDKDLLLGLGPFGDVRRLTVVVLDPKGKVVWQRTGITKAEDLRGVLRRL
jgi:hypothetical protein